MVDINTILDTLVAIAGTLGGLSPIIVQGFKLLKQSRVGKTIQTLEDISKKAVSAASQVGINLNLDNAKMYDFALQALKNEALQHGIKVDDVRLQMYIESAYKELSKDWNEANTIPTEQATTNSVVVNNDAQKTVQQTVQDAVNEAKQQVVNQFTDIVKNAVDPTVEPIQPEPTQEQPAPTQPQV